MKFVPDMSESGNEPAPAGLYQMIVAGTPKIKLSKGEKTAGLAMLAFQFNHAGGTSGPPVFQREFISGKMAWRFGALCKALGLTDAEISNIEIESAGEVSGDADAEVSFKVNGSPWNPAGKVLSVVLGVEADEGYAPRNSVKKYLKAS